MMNQIMNEHKDSIRDEQLFRLREVLPVLGGEIPKGGQVRRGQIPLANDSNHYIEFDKGRVTVVFDFSVYHYIWDSTFYDDGSMREKFSVNNGALEAIFDQNPAATETSDFYLWGHNWVSPKIYSNLNSVVVVSRDGKQVFPVDEYYDVFVSYMKSKKAYSLANNSTIVDMILNMFGSPIRQHVFDLKNRDQSWRFSREKLNILSDYDEEVNRWNRSCLETIKEAMDQYKRDMQSTEDCKDEKLKELEEVRREYCSHARVRK